MQEASFVCEIQKQRRVAIPKTTFNTMDLEKGGTVEVTIEKIKKE